MDAFPGKLYHRTPAWVAESAIFHVRIRAEPNRRSMVSDACLAQVLLDSFSVYQEQQKWTCFLVIILPDHLHALLSFGREIPMSQVIRRWKSYHKWANGVQWQDNYFDHRVRSSVEYTRTYHYILRNPVALGLCTDPDQWPWKITAMSPDAVPHF